MHARRGGLSRRVAGLKDRVGPTDVVLMAPLLLLLASTVVEVLLVGLAQASLRQSAVRTAAAIDSAGVDCVDPKEIAEMACANAPFLPYCAARLSPSRVVFPLHPTAPPAAAERAAEALLVSDERTGDLVLVKLRYEWRLFSPIAAAVWGPAQASTQLADRFAYRSGDGVEQCDQRIAAETMAAGAHSVGMSAPAPKPPRLATLAP